MPGREIEQTLSAWREAQRRLDKAVDGDHAALEAEVAKHRTRFHELSAAYMIDRLDALHEAEDRRSAATPSTPPFHQAARDEKVIASEIWDAARMSDEDTPATVRPSDSWAAREIRRLKVGD